ncbi:mevalonate kinase [Panacagrimonas sp.]|uniref:mevalonate kinase family protein n=1 Tax=Panacagrimonas sp. TaxID=2480088 RepID=UPI003B51DF86
MGEQPTLMQPIRLARSIPLVIGISRKESLTARTVGAVREAWKKNPSLYEDIFRRIDQITLQGLAAAQRDDLEQLGDLMNVCHGLLNALRVSSPEIEDLVEIARRHGALGAKLTGGGGGGSIIALCPQHRDEVMGAMREAGYQAMEVQIG